MGKYSKFKDSFTKFTGEPTYQQRVDDEKERIVEGFKDAGLKGSVNDLAHALLHARIEKARLEAEVKKHNLTIEACNQLMVERLEDDAFSQVKLDNGVSMSIKDDLYCSVSNKAVFLGWIRQTNQEDLLTVNYQTMSSLVKSRLTGTVTLHDGEEPVPPGIETYFKQTISVRGAKNLGIEE